MGKKIVIVGGVAAGATAAARLRRLDEEASIVILEKGPYVSFANCGLPYYIGGIIQERDALLVTTAEKLWTRFRIEVAEESEVVRVDPEHQLVEVRRGQELVTYAYDELILAPGAKPMTPPIPGIELPKVRVLRSVPDTDAIKAMVDDGIQSATVIGGGFIGLEVCENLMHRGVTVTLVEAAPHILAPLDTEMALICENELRAHGVRLILNDGVTSFEEEGPHITTTTKSGEKITADLVVAAIGVAPDTAFLMDSGIALNEKGYILVDPYMATNQPHIWAAGDAVSTFDAVGGGRAQIALAGPANRQGRLLADNIYGAQKAYCGALGTSILKLFDLTAASAGHNARRLQKDGIAYREAFVHPHNHAGYYPGAQQMCAKILFAPDGTLLGAQVVGQKGTDKLIDVLATALHFGGTVEDLEELDLAYAPPYLSAKSPANLLGYVAANQQEELVQTMTIEEWQHCETPQNDLLLDVRNPEEVAQGALPGALNIPLDSLRDRLGELPKDRRIVAYCQVGLRGYLACRILTQYGFDCVNLQGGYRLFHLGDPQQS
ncbi:hypothetical protein ABB02_01659 [Clostridiaceae bacterium JG1575]|nr:hypothetical protein ABB02_01659 [Clostridiaceae bacterium JG1575]